MKLLERKIKKEMTSLKNAISDSVSSLESDVDYAMDEILENMKVEWDADVLVEAIVNTSVAELRASFNKLGIEREIAREKLIEALDINESERMVSV